MGVSACRGYAARVCNGVAIAALIASVHESGRSVLAQVAAQHRRGGIRCVQVPAGPPTSLRFPLFGRAPPSLRHRLFGKPGLAPADQAVCQHHRLWRIAISGSIWHRAAGGHPLPYFHVPQVHVHWPRDGVRCAIATRRARSVTCARMGVMTVTTVTYTTWIFTAVAIKIV